MIGTSAETGKIISGMEHLRQSISRLLTTPVGSRVMRRDYGSYVFELIDQPGNKANKLKVYSAIVDALLRWEPRVLPTKVTLISNTPESGQFEIDIEGIAVTDIDDISAGGDLHLSVPLWGAA